jgi:hypothetical protein
VLGSLLKGVNHIVLHLDQTVLSTTLHKNLRKFLQAFRSKFAKYLSERKMLPTEVIGKNTTDVVQYDFLRRCDGFPRHC